jgi:hypothetical protein
MYGSGHPIHVPVAVCSIEHQTTSLHRSKLKLSWKHAVQATPWDKLSDQIPVAVEADSWEQALQQTPVYQVCLGAA